MNIDPTIQTAALAGLEQAINQALKLDPGTRQKLQALAGSCFLVHCSDLELTVFILLTEHGIELKSHHEQVITAALSGPLSAYLQLLRSDDKGAELINGELQFQGNSQPLLQMQQALSDLELDWEGQLATLVGDVPSHLLGKGVRHLAQFGRRASDSFTRHLEEYLHEEGRLLPSRLEVEDFYDDLARLRERTERLEAKLLRLQQQRQAATQAPPDQQSLPLKND